MGSSLCKQAIPPPHLSRELSCEHCFFGLSHLSPEVSIY